MAVLQTAALPLGYAANSIPYLPNAGAGNGIWTRDFDLGKVALYHWVIPAQTSDKLPCVDDIVNIKLVKFGAFF